jgi:hypothetical protein
MAGNETNPGNNTGGIIQRVPGGLIRDNNDENQFRWGRDRNLGFKIGSYLQAPPMLFTRDGHSLPLADLYRGRCGFIIASGPSFGELINGKSEKHGKTHREMLDHPGVLTMAMNNAVKTFRPDMWTCVDDPMHFIKSIWLDPKIQKFAPFHHAEKKIFDSDTWEEMDMRVGDCPNVLYYRRNEDFIPEQFLTEDSFNWGNHTDKIDEFGQKGGRSVLFVALRMMFYLGVRNLFLLGVDFNMSEKDKYHFEQDRHKGSINGNNSSYKIMMKRFEALKPFCDQMGFNVFNCNPNSALKAFPFKPFEEAWELATSEMPINIANERTAGLYDRTHKKEEEAKKALKAEGAAINDRLVKEVVKSPGNYPDAVKVKVKVDLDRKRQALDIAKKELADFEALGKDQPNYDAKKDALSRNVTDRRTEFRNLEKQKNLIWFGKETK